ncbi:DUF2514 family protein [Variovorax sp. IB41]|uniref:DUF2514 family protein n=1 Tax=Variovorax sp. IB41 TaxID=2779370 RepID=UPI0018E89E8D|nr:DUF2514 family protein [Variovorax sp. IB41]MBJ2155254.1 DUF2514 family protein [Variovorax sp. IB41]
MLLDLKAPLLWGLGLALVAALATAGIERTRAAGARTDAAKARQELAEYRGTMAESARLAERAQRIQEQTWRDRVDGVIQDGQKQIAAARADADDAARAAGGLRNQLATFRAAVRAASAAPTAPGGGAPAADPLDLLSDLFGRADTRAGDLARIADERGAAGTVCERHADATTPP